MSTKKVLNKKRLFYVIIISILVILFGIVGVKVGMDVSNTKPKQVKKELDEITPYGYKLDDRDTAIYKKYFNSLEKTLKEKPIDNEKYAKGLTKLFIVDFYTLSNKLASTDVGGLEFIHKDLIENFKLNAQETVYKTIKSNLYNERDQKLPEVSEVTIDSVTKSTYVYNSKKYESYIVDATWTYKENMGYDTKGEFVLIKDNNKLNIVEERHKQDETSSSESM